ncbi:DUF7266 family protein [Haladaptatus sp. CMSO5]|uniref:DUF7266 family protein n=1 Tax=Haladaptatus sp. CMSO5 TaxID=3120514 RepID=UPI002FCDF775
MQLDNRGVASTLNYILGLGIATILVIGLLTAGGNLVSDQREQVVRGELSVIGQQLVSDITAADRLTADTGTVRIEREMPLTVAGEHYRARISTGADPTDNLYFLNLTSSTTDVTEVVSFTSSTTVSGSVDGGSIVIEKKNGGTQEIMVKNG